MRKAYIYSIIFFLAILPLSDIYSQELKAKITINSSQIQGVDKQVFTTLENSLMQLLNERKWTETTFKNNERIDCNFTITLNSAPEENSYSGEIQVTSTRPVYNSSYMTPMFMYRDVDVTFNYISGENIEFNEAYIENNLVAIVAFYTYVIIGLDFDSFSPNGGKPYFEKAMEIVNASQHLSKKGWAAFDSDKNRYALGLALTEESSNSFHTLWYNYHRLGLDEMGTNALRGRDKIIAAIQGLQTVYSSRPSSPLLLFFGDTKLSELGDIYSEASTDEKKEAYDLLQKIFPSKSSQLNRFKPK